GGRGWGGVWGGSKGRAGGRPGGDLWQGGQGWNRRHRGHRLRRRGRDLVVVIAPAETDGREPLQERRAALLWMLLLEFAAAGANLFLRRHRQFVDPRHAHAARRHPLRLRRGEGVRLTPRLRRRRRRGG